VLQFAVAGQAHRVALGGAPPTCTQEGAGTQPGGSQLAGATGGAQPGASQLPGSSGGPQSYPRCSQLPGASGEAQPSPGGLQLPGASGGQPGSSHEVAGSTTAVATPQPTGDGRRRQMHPRDPLTYPRQQTHATTQAARLLRRPGDASLGRILFVHEHCYM
jgi:hypothetical protein